MLIGIWISCEGVKYVNDLPEKSSAIPNKVIDLLVDDTLRRNGIDLEHIKGKLSDQQKQTLKEIVEDLTKQVDAFKDQPTSTKKDSN